jgi:epidermal growth factor receptor substrate 15
MYTQAAGESNSVRGKEAVTFFKRSGLPVEKLKSIWILAARTSNEYLTKEEFYVALRLIAYHQNGMAADENSINHNVEVGLPRLDSGMPSGS